MLLLSVISALLNAQESEVVELDDFEVVGKYLQSDQITSLKTPTPIEDIPKSLTILNIRFNLSARFNKHE